MKFIRASCVLMGVSRADGPDSVSSLSDDEDGWKNGGPPDPTGRCFPPACIGGGPHTRNPDDPTAWTEAENRDEN